MEPVLFGDDPQFWHETQRMLGHASYGGSDTGEVLAAAARIVPGNHDSWHDQWLTTADRIASEAEVALVNGHLVSARDGFLRASTYYRGAASFLHGQGEDPRFECANGRQVESFRWAAALLDPPVDPVEIPYDDAGLSGYFYTGTGSGPRPTIVMHNGFDGSAEEMHFFGAAAAVERGYNVLSFDGPARPAARRPHALAFRPDWEHVVWQVMDWVLDRPEVDGARVTLLGVGTGGYLAVRAAAFEQRLAGCIAMDGIFDLGAVGIAQDLEETPELYTLADGIAEQVRCPTAICAGGSDASFDGRPDQVYEHLVCPKRFFQFSDAEGAGARCRSGAQRLAFGRVYDWLDETLEHTMSLPVATDMLEHSWVAV
jgi:pimeloyl-ACP methyl ester carboxylesterase